MAAGLLADGFSVKSERKKEEERERERAREEERERVCEREREIKNEGTTYNLHALAY